MTAQPKDFIYIKGKEEQMATKPLESLLEMDIHLRFKAFQDGCWRSYIGSWIVEDDKLYLIKFKCNLVGRNDDTYLNLQDLFPGEDKIFATWFSGKLEIERGELLDYERIGSYNKYEQSLFLIIEKGLKTHEFIIDRTKFPF